MGMASPGGLRREEAPSTPCRSEAAASPVPVTGAGMRATPAVRTSPMKSSFGVQSAYRPRPGGPAKRTQRNPAARKRTSKARDTIQHVDRGRIGRHNSLRWRAIMVDSTLPDPLRGRAVPDRRFRDARREFEWTDPSAFHFWPGLPRRVSRALALIILLAMLPGILAAFSRGASAGPGEALLAHTDQPPSVRLVLVSADQRQVAQEFTTDPRPCPAGHDVLAAAVRIESTGAEPVVRLAAGPPADENGSLDASTSDGVVNDIERRDCPGARAGSPAPVSRTTHRGASKAHGERGKML